jgi:hypothetical protein
VTRTRLAPQLEIVMSSLSRIVVGADAGLIAGRLRNPTAAGVTIDILPESSEKSLAGGDCAFLRALK